MSYSVAMIGATFFFPLLFGLSSRRTTPAAAAASSVAGFFTTLVWTGFTIAKAPWATTVHPIVPGLLVAFVAIVGVTPFSKPTPPEALARFFKPARRAGDGSAPVQPLASVAVAAWRCPVRIRDVTDAQGGSDARTDVLMTTSGAAGGGRRRNPRSGARRRTAIARRARGRRAGGARKDDGHGAAHRRAWTPCGSRSSPGSKCATRCKAGKTTIIIPTGGMEQNGPYLATGKHNYVNRAGCEAIARKLGNALCGPNVAFVPEGNFEPPTGALMYPGSIGVSDTTFRALLTDIAESFRVTGFSNVILLGDSGGNQRGMKQVAAAISRRNGRARRAASTTSPTYYDDFNQVIAYAEKTFGWKQVPDGSHDDALITAIMMTVSPDHVRMKQRIAKGKTATNSIPLVPGRKDRGDRPCRSSTSAPTSRSPRSRRRSPTPLRASSSPRNRKIDQRSTEDTEGTEGGAGIRLSCLCCVFCVFCGSVLCGE